MTGAVMALAASATAIAGTGTTVSPPPAWTNIFDIDVGSTNTINIAGITSPISVSAAITGSAHLFYILNGVFSAYTGAFTVGAGDNLGWTVENDDSHGVSGVITVTNTSASQTLATISYHVTYSGHS